MNSMQPFSSCDGRSCCRGRLSRRRFGAAAGGAAIAAGSGFGLASPAAAQGVPANPADPKPIPGGLQLAPGAPLIHVFGPMPGMEPATITDFNGVVGIADCQGTGKGRDTTTGQTTDLVFDVDMRFMQGVYLGVDGRQRSGTFGLI